MKKTVIVLTIIPLLAFSLHKYYISLTEIEFVKDKKTVQIITNVFVDDIEKAINENYLIDAKLNTKKEIKNVDAFFFKYLKEHLSIKINKKNTNYQFIGKEYEGNIVFFYLEIENITKITSINVKNSILIKEFSSQQNIIKLKINNKKDSFILTKENDKGLLKF